MVAAQNLAMGTRSQAGKIIMSRKPLSKTRDGNTFVQAFQFPGASARASPAPLASFRGGSVTRRSCWTYFLGMVGPGPRSSQELRFGVTSIYYDRD